MTLSDNLKFLNKSAKLPPIKRRPTGIAQELKTEMISQKKGGIRFTPPISSFPLLRVVSAFISKMKKSALAPVLKLVGSILSIFEGLFFSDRANQKMFKTMGSG